MVYDPMNPYMNYGTELYYRQMAEMYGQQLAWEEETGFRQDGEVQRILQFIIRRRPAILQQIEVYGVPQVVSRAIARRIIRFTLDNAAQIPGNLQRKVQVLFNRFIAQNQVVVLTLRLYGVPQNVIERFIRQVITVTLRQMETGGDLEQEVERILRRFEAQFPQFLGLTSVYGIPRPVAREITRGIIRFTLVNIERVSPFGTLNQRAQQMLLLLDREQPQLIRAMINRGVPAGVAENITLQIIRFTIRIADEDVFEEDFI